MGSDLTLQAMDGANAEAYFSRHLGDADPLGQLSPCQFDLVGFGTWSAKPPAHLARLADELAVAGDLLLDDAQPSPDTLADHRAFELGEITHVSAADTAQQLTEMGL
jgi:hypothetical protein